MRTTQAIDWISVTFPYDHLVKLDGADFSTEVRAHNGYTMARRNEFGAVLMINPDRHDMGKHLIMSGTTCTNYRAAGFNDGDLLTWAMAGRIARLDLAIDVFEHAAPFDTLAKMLKDGKAQTNAKTYSRINTLSGAGDTIYIGKRPSTVMRIYDKAAQTGQEIDWVRIEVEFKGDKARHASKLLKASKLEDYRPVMQGFAKFNDVQWWTDVMGSKIEATKGERRESDTWLWLLKQCAPALAREIKGDSSKLHLFVAHVIDMANEGDDD